MMVNCPKCGFNQPKDEFCANCGVDMYVFGSAQRKTRNLQVGVYVGSGLLVIAVTLFFATGRRTEKVKNLASEVFHDMSEPKRLLSARVQLDGLKSAPADSGTSQQTSPRQPQVEVDGAQAAAPESSRGAMAVASHSLVPDSGSPGGGTVGSSSAASVSAEPTLPTRLKIEMYLVDTPGIKDIISQSQNRDQIGEVEFGKYLDIEKKLKDLAAQGGKQISIHSQRPVLQPGKIISAGAESKAKIPIGFELTLSPISIEIGSVAMQIDHFFFANAEERDRPNFPARNMVKMNFRNGAWESIWMRGVLRHVSEEVGAMGSSSSILEYLTNEEFITGRSEFLVVITPQ